jgi:hypothetical protein
VAQLQAQLKRGILDELWQIAKVQNITLEDAIRDFKSASWNRIRTGQFVIASAGAGHSVTFASPELFRNLTQDQYMMLGMEFLEVMADAITTNGFSGDLTSDQQQTVFTTMMADDRLQTVRSHGQDYTTLRWPAIATTQ